MQIEWVGSKRGRSAHIAIEGLGQNPEALCGSRGDWDQEWDKLPQDWRACEHCINHAAHMATDLLVAVNAKVSTC